VGPGFLLAHLPEGWHSNPVQVVNSGEDAIDYLSGAGRYSDWKEFPLPSMFARSQTFRRRWPRRAAVDRQQPGLRALRVAMLTSSDLSQEIMAATKLELILSNEADGPG